MKLVSHLVLIGAVNIAVILYLFKKQQRSKIFKNKTWSKIRITTTPFSFK